MEEKKKIIVEETTEEATENIEDVEIQTTFNETSVEELIDEEGNVENVSDRCE